MNELYVLDSCALLAAITDEPGADIVRRLFDDAVSGNKMLIMHKLNLLEVYYDLLRRFGNDAVTDFLVQIASTPLIVIPEITDDVFFMLADSK